MKGFLLLLYFCLLPLPAMALTVAEETQALNQDLERYKQALTLPQSRSARASLYFNIGNTFFRLQEYPWAILYYENALQISPRESSIHHNLRISRSALSLEDTPQSYWQKIGSVFLLISLYESLALLGICILIFFFCASWYLWKPFNFLKKAMIFMGIGSAFFFLHAMSLTYITPLEGITVKATLLYRGPGKQYATVMNQPLLPGINVAVQDVVDRGKWLKVSTPDGNVGYITDEAIRIIGQMPMMPATKL